MYCPGDRQGRERGRRSGRRGAPPHRRPRARPTRSARSSASSSEAARLAGGWPGDAGQEPGPIMARERRRPRSDHGGGPGDDEDQIRRTLSASTASCSTTAASTSGPTCSPKTPGCPSPAGHRGPRRRSARYDGDGAARRQPRQAHDRQLDWCDVDGDTATGTTDYLFVRAGAEGIGHRRRRPLPRPPGPRGRDSGASASGGSPCSTAPEELRWLRRGCGRSTLLERAHPARSGRALRDRRIGRPDFVPAERYYDPEFADLERAHLWPRVWQMACRLEEIPAPGDFVEYTICDQSILVVRVDDVDRRCLPQRLPAPGHRAGQRDRDASTRAGSSAPSTAGGGTSTGENSFVYGAARVRPGAARARGALSPPGPGRDLGRLRVGQPRPGRAAPARGARSDAEPARPARRRRHAGRLVEGGHPPGQLEAGPGGVHGGLPRPPDPPPAHPRSPRAATTRTASSTRSTTTVIRASSSVRTPRPRRDAQVGVGEIDAIIESVHLLNIGPRGDDPRPRRARDRGDAQPADPRGQHLRRRAGQGALRATPPAPGSRCRHPIPPPWPAGAGCSSMLPQLLRAPPVRQRARLPGRGPNGDDPESCLFELWSLTIPAAGDDAPSRRSPRDRSHPTTPTTGRASRSRTSPTSAASSGASTAWASTVRASRTTYEAGIVNMHRELDRYLAS